VVKGTPNIGKGTFIGFFSEVNAKDSFISIGVDCDIASYVSINCADSHKRCIGLSDEIGRKPIFIGDNVFIGSHCFVKGGSSIGHHSVIAAGSIVSGKVKPYSLVYGNPMIVREGYYSNP